MVTSNEIGVSGNLANPFQYDIGKLNDVSYNLRSRMLRMAADKGEGYIAQGLGMADLLSVVYFSILRYSLNDPDARDRDLFLLSTGHYSIALYSALAEVGFLSSDEIDSYGLNGSALPMSTFDGTPGVEITSGSLGHGLGQGVGAALGSRFLGVDRRTIVELSDGEMQEGSTWEAAMSAASHGLDNLWAVVDCNGVQADGRLVIDIEPVADKWRSFGWNAVEVDGNDVEAIHKSLTSFLVVEARPSVLILRTRPGYGVPTLMAREKAHFVRVDEGEWDKLIEELEANRGKVL